MKLIEASQEMFHRFDRFISGLSNLDTPIRDIHTYFGSVYKEGKLLQELNALERVSKDKKGWVSEVEQSIKQLFTISKYQRVARVVAEAATALGQTKAFPIVAQILSSDDDKEAFQSLPMKQVNDDLIRAGRSFSAWTDQEIQVLESLPVCGALLLWLKGHINDRNDLKTFYDLATISAGESDHELDRVSHFYQAVSGYAPLILELKAESCSFAEFQEACKSVFATLTSDPNLADKLVTSNRNLEWIKACKDQQGSVEQTSLTTVSKINLTGVFQIGLSSKSSSKSLDNCIKLRYQKISSHVDETKELSLEQLKELNSKLMLITAGTEGKKDVERFSRILGLAEQVGRLYLDLVKAGCHLFSKWQMTVSFFF